MTRGIRGGRRLVKRRSLALREKILEPRPGNAGIRAAAKLTKLSPGNGRTWPIAAALMDRTQAIRGPLRPRRSAGTARPDAHRREQPQTLRARAIRRAPASIGNKRAASCGKAVNRPRAKEERRTATGLGRVSTYAGAGGERIEVFLRGDGAAAIASEAPAEWEWRRFRAHFCGEI